MAQFNYGINCDDSKKALKIYKHIDSINIVQDGLDVSDERVSVISNQHLLKEIEKFAEGNVGAIRVEIWDDGKDFDDAESDGTLKVIELEGKATSKTSKALKPVKFATYSGNKNNLEKFKSWLVKSNPSELAFVSEWEPKVEFGSYGIEFQCDDPKFDKAANKEWMSKGVVTERRKS